jgi:hypothetical protein
LWSAEVSLKQRQTTKNDRLSYSLNKILPKKLLGMRVRRRQQGFVLIAMSMAMVLLLAFIGLAFDFGRLYIARNEAQVYTDAAALTAASRLDGTLAGVRKARTAVEHLPGSWNLGTEPFKGVVTEFSSNGLKWTETPEKGDSSGPWTYARVSAPSNDLGILFLRAAGGPESIRVLSHSAAQTNPVRLVE